MSWIEERRYSIAFLPFGNASSDLDNFTRSVRTSNYRQLELIREVTLCLSISKRLGAGMKIAADFVEL